MRILFVCTGNICRSPLGERYSRAFLDRALGASAAAVGTMSAGTHAVVGRDMDPSSQRVLAELGGEPSGFRAQQLTPDMVDAADLTLTMTRRHRRDVLKLAPRAMFRTYTLREAEDLLRRVDPRRLPALNDLDGRARALVAMLGEQRATRGRVEGDADDVQDPIGARPEVHQEVGRQIAASLTPLLEALCTSAAPAQRSVALPAVPPPRPRLSR